MTRARILDAIFMILTAIFLLVAGFYLLVQCNRPDPRMPAREVLVEKCRAAVQARLPQGKEIINFSDLPDSGYRTPVYSRQHTRFFAEVENGGVNYEYRGRCKWDKTYSRVLEQLA